MFSKVEDSAPELTLIKGVEQLLLQNKKIGVLVIDEDHRAIFNPQPTDSHVTQRQEEVLKFAISHKLPVWFIDSTRKQLTDIVENYDQFAIIHKGDANGFGDGYSWKMPHFADTGLHTQLQNKNISHLIVMGFHVHCCVQLTVGANSDTSTYGKGALQYGYEVITSGDILRSSASSPAGEERCKWKHCLGVTYFDSIKPNLSLEKLETASTKQCKDSVFKNPFSIIKKLLEQKTIQSIDGIEDAKGDLPSQHSQIIEYK